MTICKIHRGLRLEPTLNKFCNMKALECDMSFSEWVRQILRREVGLKKRDAHGKKK